MAPYISIWFVGIGMSSIVDSKGKDGIGMTSKAFRSEDRWAIFSMENIPL